MVGAPRRHMARALAPPPEPDPPALVRVIDGVTVIKDEPYPSPLSKPDKFVPFTGMRILTLADQSTRTGCADCDFVGTRGEIKKHRAADHGVPIGGAPRGKKTPVVTDLLPPALAGMTLAQLLDVVQDFDAYSQLAADQADQIQEMRERALAAETELRKIRGALGRAGFSPVEE